MIDAGPAMTPLVLELDGELSRAALPSLSAHVQAVLDTHEHDIVECDLAHAAADAVTVEALARLRLATLRRDCPLTLRGVTPELRQLIEFMGLRAALG
ncbi:MAG: STAS domain-containing protein [Actinobacteria bacterium]|nr:MAG: STAS domain-containing protein [Actinomycetota bacterium]